jgi:hypothetical protein
MPVPLATTETLATVPLQTVVLAGLALIDIGVLIVITALPVPVLLHPLASLTLAMV